MRSGVMLDLYDLESVAREVDCGTRSPADLIGEMGGPDGIAREVLWLLSNYRAMQDAVSDMTRRERVLRDFIIGMTSVDPLE